MIRLVVLVAFILSSSVIAVLIDDKAGVEIRGRFPARVLHHIVARVIGAGILFILFYWNAG